jgi:uncharacterized SAM-binding protein YcdF (DUF218 family)
VKALRSIYRAVQSLALLIVLIQGLVFLTLDKILMLDEPLTKADYAVVLDGDNTRLLRAKDLYDQGLVTTILVSDGEPANPSQIDRITESLGYRAPDRTQIKREILEELGVPKERIAIFGHASLNTRDEARGLRDYLKDQPARVILVTNSYHSRRAKAVFETYAPNAEYSVACLNGCVAPEGWRSSPSLVSSYVLEFVKTIYFRLGLASS